MVNVHVSPDMVGTSIACSNIGGIVDGRENGEDQELSAVLTDLNESGYVGVAWLGDDGNGGTNVGFTLVNLGKIRGHGTMTATPAPQAPRAAGQFRHLRRRAGAQ